MNINVDVEFDYQILILTQTGGCCDLFRKHCCPIHIDNSTMLRFRTIDSTSHIHTLASRARAVHKGQFLSEEGIQTYQSLIGAL